MLCLRGGKEHKELKFSQFSFGEDSSGSFVVYTENGSKNRSGSYKEKAGDNKVVKHYANAELGERCYVYILKYYYSKIPPQLLLVPDSVFYWRPLDAKPKDDASPWFSKRV